MNKEYPPKRPVRFFNTTGPCEPWNHYMLPPADRIIGGQLDFYIRDRLYWVLHAPRQTGKTTFLDCWARELNAAGEVTACYVNIEACQPFSDPERCMPVLCDTIKASAKEEGLPVPELKTANPGSMLSNILTNFSELVAPKPLVILFDEADTLRGDAMMSFLRQLRGSFKGRGVGTFPISVALVGMRGLKDYITADKGGIAPTPGSPFNIKEDSALIGNFSQDDVRALFAQRTEETGQQIAPDALEYVWEQSMGQPWIVNSLFKRATRRVLKEDDYSTITLEYVKNAREQMILARETHLDSLAFRLEDPAIRLNGLLKAFQSFWREHSEMWEQKSDYTEAFPHLLIMSFLQRILNGGARIDREYAVGRGRMDLLIEHNNKFYVIEVKMIYENKSPKSVKAEGLAQIARYRDTKAPGAPAYLVIFDRRPSAKKTSWNKKIMWTTEGDVTVLGC